MNSLTTPLEKPACSRCGKTLKAQWDDLGATPLCKTCRFAVRWEFNDPSQAFPLLSKPLLPATLAATAMPSASSQTSAPSAPAGQRMVARLRGRA